MSDRKVLATDVISVLSSLVGVRSSLLYLSFLVEVGSLANASLAARREDSRWIAMVGS